MKLEKFIDHVKKQGVMIIDSDEPHFDLRYMEDFRKLKQFVQHINFDCQIKETGGCKEFDTFVNCCCFSCYERAGFFRMMIDTDLNYYARRFTLHNGFWRDGCKLPHRMRSTTCLTHHCNSDNKKYPGFGFGMM